MALLRAEESLLLQAADARVPARPEIFYLGVLAEGQHPRLLLCDGRGVDDDGFFLVFGGSVDLGTVAALGLVAAGLVEELPVLLGEVVDEGVHLVDANLVVFLLEVEQQLQRVRPDEQLPHELVLPRLAGDENGAVEEGSSRDEQADDGLQVVLIDLVLVHPEVLVDEGQEVLEDEDLGLEGLAGVGEAVEYVQLEALAVLVLADDVAAQLVDLGLQEDLGDAGFRHQFDLLDAGVDECLVEEGGRVEEEADGHHEGVEVVEAVCVEEVADGLCRRGVDGLDHLFLLAVGDVVDLALDDLVSGERLLLGEALVPLGHVLVVVGGRQNPHRRYPEGRLLVDQLEPLLLYWRVILRREEGVDHYFQHLVDHEGQEFLDEVVGDS